MDTWITRGFWAAAAFNIVGMAVFSKLLTNTILFETDPEMFSRPACVLVMIWGLAYLAQSLSWRSAPAVTAVFVVEKAIFAGWWGFWLWGHASQVPEIMARDLLAGSFYAVYGAGDAVFMVFFAFVSLRTRG